MSGGGGDSAGGLAADVSGGGQSNAVSEGAAPTQERGPSLPVGALLPFDDQGPLRSPAIDPGAEDAEGWFDGLGHCAVSLHDVADRRAHQRGVVGMDFTGFAYAGADLAIAGIEASALDVLTLRGRHGTWLTLAALSSDQWRLMQEVFGADAHLDADGLPLVEAFTAEEPALAGLLAERRPHGVATRGVEAAVSHIATLATRASEATTRLTTGLAAVRAAAIQERAVAPQWELDRYRALIATVDEATALVQTAMGGLAYKGVYRSKHVHKLIF